MKDALSIFSNIFENKISEFDNVIFASHDDMDGTGVPILLKRLFPKEKIKKIFFYNIYLTKEETYINLIKRNPNSLILFTDISFKIEQKRLCNFLKYQDNVLFIDHHETSNHLKKYDWAYIDNRYSATYLTYLILDKIGCNVKEFELFSRLIDDYDSWKHKDPRSQELNTLFSVKGQKDFYDEFSKKPFKSFNEIERALISYETKKRNKYIMDKCKNDLIIKDTEFGKCGFVFAEEDQDNLGNYIVKNYDVAFCALIRSGKRVSLRSIGEFDVAQIAQKFNGGGHKNASGFTLDDKCREEFLKKIF